MAKAKPKKGVTKTRAIPGAGLGGRHPKTIARGPGDGQDRPKFSFRYADRSDNGGWRWPEGDDAAEVLNFLADMSCLTWTEIKAQLTGSGKYGPRHKKHHYQAFDTVSPEAQKRFAQLGLERTFEEYFRFRLAGEKRLWGFLVEGVFYVLWWDTAHKVCLTEKRNT